jgi:Ca-activated chloride channel homolog
VKTFFGLAAAAALALSSATTPNGAQQPPIFSAKSELVVLHVLVKDHKGAYVGRLNADAFQVFEDRQPQTVSFFEAEDAPVTIGLLIDSSGSMRAVRNQVIAASAAFVESSNPDDEVFALVFDDDVRPVLGSSAPFTGDAVVLRQALTDVFEPAGRTALYDAIDSGLRYALKGSRERHALIVLSDGGDNASRAGFTDALISTQASNAIVYTVALLGASDDESDPGKLARFAVSSGGAAFAPRDVAGVERAFAQISQDIRHSYTIGYQRALGARPGFHRIQLEVRAPNGRKLVTRTREGYHASP